MRRIGVSIRHARLAAVAFTVVLMTVLGTCQVDALASGSTSSGGALLGSALVVPGVESLVGGQLMAAEEAERAAPEAVAARERSRTAYRHLASSRVGQLLGDAFPTVIREDAGGAPQLPEGARILSYPSVHSAQLALPGHQIGIVESTWPLAKSAGHGRFAPIDLTLTASGDGYVPARPSVSVRIPTELSRGVRTPQNGVTLTLVDSRGRALSGHGAVEDSSVIYPNTQHASDTVVKPTPTGFQLDEMLRSLDSPQQLLFKVDAPSGATLAQDPVSGLVHVRANGVTLATILPPGAKDAAGTTVPASMSVAGDTVTVNVDHQAGSYLYPIDVDPEINDSQLATTSGGKRGNWVFKSSNEAKFGHSAVYEGPGKEHLETSGIAEYNAAEFGYWAYETKGNSKIYEVKTRTSAKNKLAKIESILQFSSSAGNENSRMLSNEFEEPEYSEKVTTFCAWNASKVEECLPSAGKEKNALRFQQSATASPGANFKFSDTMNEGIVSISEPAGEHSTTSFNTTSSEVEGEVEEEGKKVMQKRVNALFGTGTWLTKFKGALQFISKDPGIGVATTRLEYEKSAGSWEKLSEHHYLEAENLCQGVQCYAEHPEYWTVDPKLPDGEDKIRYRAEEAIAGTVSPEAEAGSTKTVKVDTAAPHSIFLGGLPFGNELSEKPYKLTATAIDGTGSTVASSGVKRLALFVSGHEVTELGTQTGCSVPKGECLAKAEWSINGAELGAGHHAIVIVATDNAGNEARAEETITIRHSTPVALGPGSVDLQSGDFTLGSTDVSLGSGLTVGRNHSSRNLMSGVAGPLGPQWNLDLGNTESLIELVDHGMLMTDTSGRQTIFAPLSGGKFESPVGDSNLQLTVEENSETKQKLAFYLKDSAKNTSVKFTQPAGTTIWVPAKQEGTVATDTLSYTYQKAEQFTEYNLPAESRPRGITAGPDGKMWFTENATNKVAKVTAAGQITEYASVKEPSQIIAGPDGNMWFTSGLGGRTLARMTTSGGVPVGGSGWELAASGGAKIAAGPDGNVWFVVTPSTVGKITPSGTITKYTLPAESNPTGVASGPDGNLWVTENKANKIAKVTTSGAIAAEYTLPAGSKPASIEQGPDGKVWFIDEGTKKIGKITTTGTITEYSLAAGVAPGGPIIVGSDGALWFSEVNTPEEKIEKLAKITTSGTVTVFPVAPAEASLNGIAPGPEGNIWFAANFSEKIGFMAPSGSVEPTEILAPKPAGVSCVPMKAGCRALKFTYATSTTAKGEIQSEWGTYKGRLSKISLNAYNPVSKVMQETAVAEYSYDKLGRLRAEWDPRVSPALKTSYGYDVEGHITALTPPGQESWGFIYGTIAGDSGTGRLLKVTRAPASAALWGGEKVTNTGLPYVSGSAVVGLRMAAIDDTWSGSPFTFSYQWKDCDTAGENCTAIVGANNANYTPTSSDLGHTLVALVTATNADGSVVATSMNHTAVVVVQSVEYPVAGGSPYQVTLGSDSNIWFGDLATSKVGKITSSGTVTEYPTGKSGPYGITFASGNAWFVENSGHTVSRMTTEGVLTGFALTRTVTGNWGIVLGPDGNLWFTESKTNYIGKMNTSGELLAEYALPAGSEPHGIIQGYDGHEAALWFANTGTSKIGKITTAGVITEYALPAGSQPYALADDQNEHKKLWFVNAGTNKVGKIDPLTGATTEYALPAGSVPEAIASGPGEMMWFTEWGGNRLGQISTKSGAITEHALPTGSVPGGIHYGSGYMWFAEFGTHKMAKFDPEDEEGEVKSPEPGYAIEYGTPLSGTGLPTMTGSEVAKWGQTDSPVEATAILPPDAKQGWPAASYNRATVYYLDSHGRTVNASSPSNAPYGSVATTEYNEFNDIVRTLSPDNRQTALEAESKSVEVAKLLDVESTYNGEGAHESEVEEAGTRLIETLGPQHQVKYMAGSEQKESLARLHTKLFYDEGAPTGTYDLLTKKTTLAQLANEEEVEVRKTTTSYSGQSNLGWTLRAPTSVTVDPEGKKLTSTTVYNSSTAQITETRSPAGSAGGSAHDTKLIYYSAEANTEGYAACGLHPEWAGLLCETLPAKQPESGGLPQLPVTTTTYNIWNEPLVMTETFGSTVRTKTKTYDESGRFATSETSSSANTALPKVTNEYNSKTGVLEKQSTTVEAKTTSVTGKYDTFGRLIEYTDADGNIAKYRYGGLENDGLLEEVADGSNSGTGKQTYTYNATTKLREELWDSAAGTFSASYDAEGNLVKEVYPNAMCANYIRNSAGEATHVEYIKTTNCSESGAPVWFSESRNPAVRGEAFSRTSTLASETYSYDTVGRLTEAHETPSGEGCRTRLYAYDEESNRTSQTTRAPGGEGKCATEGGTVVSHTYDEGNRLTDAGVAYDSFGDVTKLPAADAEGHELSSTFYVDNAVATQSQNGVTSNYYLDPEGRVRETVSGGNAIVAHYDGPGETVAWTSESGGKSTRNIPGIDGSLSATQANGGTPVLQLHDLKGNVVATAALGTSETKLLSTYNSTEFGVPNAEKAPPKFAWLGAAGIASSLSSGVITYGSTSYVPQTGMALQSEQVEPPGAPSGSGGGAAYTSQEEPWVMQGAASRAAEAPGLEAAREQAAIEAAIAAAVDPKKFVYMNKTKAREKAAGLLATSILGRLAEIVDIPGDLVEAAVDIGTGIAMESVYQWFEEAAGKLSKCGNNKWNIVGAQKVNICRLQYDVIEAKVPVVGTIKFVNFLEKPYVWECFKVNEDPCFHEVFIPKAPEEKGIVVVA